MFESTVSAQALSEGDNRLGSLSAAAFAHLAIGSAIVAAAAMLVQPAKIKEPSAPIEIVIPLAPPAAPDPGGPPSTPNRGSPAALPAPTPEPLIPPPDVPPQDTPERLPERVEESPAAGLDGPDDVVGTPDGNGNGDGGSGRTGDGTGLDGGGGGGAGLIDGPVYVTGDIVKPVLLTRVEPEYPIVPRRAGLGGRVTISAIVGLDGSIESAELLASTNPLFDRAALDAVRKWRYRPATMNGKPVRVYFTVVVDFVVR